MNTKNYSATYLVHQSPKEIFNAILNVREWWSGLYGEEIEGHADQLNDEFTFRAGGGMHYSKQKLVELVPYQNIVWQVTESALTFIDKTDEWVGTTLCFEFAEKGDHTEVRFTHIGLVPQIECYNDCSNGWSGYLEKFLGTLGGENKKGSH